MVLLNRYEYNPKADLIGTGGFSKVYKAFDKKLKRPVALKIYRTSEISDRYNPITEIQRVADLDHPNICRYLDIDEIENENSFGETEQIQICVMELLDGGDIAKYYRAHQDLNILKKLILDVLHGLAYLHKKGIIHRDIKPANIIIKLSEDGPVAKITDFGISKILDTNTSNSASALIVSIPYLAPEQLNPEKYGIQNKIAFNLDLWTLGVAVYEIITGKALFKSGEKETSEETMMNIQSTELLEKIRELPQPFLAMISECLVRDAKLRVKSADALIPVLMADYPEEEKKDVDETRIYSNPVPETEEQTKIPDIKSNLDETKILVRPEVLAASAKTNISDEQSNVDETKILVTPAKSNISEEQTSVDETKILVTPAKTISEAETNTDETKIRGPIKNIAEVQNPESNDDTKVLYGSVPDSHTTGLFQRKDGTSLLFNRYEYIPSNDLIGRGGFSRVYKAYDQKLNRWVALKVYKTGEFSERYNAISEIRRVINLDHSNICRYLDIEEIDKVNHFGENEKIQVCVMELLDGGNLAEYYRTNKDPETLKILIRGILNGLSYLHKNNIIHRDIKPANILIKKTIEGPVAKITDFGISKISDSVNSNSSSALIVSIPYMAPEQLNPKKYGINEKISYNLDLWSLGVTIYEVITGNVLFKNSEQDNSEQIMTNIMAPELPEKINELPEPFRNIVAHCIVKNANERAKKADELLVLLNGTNSIAPAPYYTQENLDQTKVLADGKKSVIYATERKIIHPEKKEKIQNDSGLQEKLPVPEKKSGIKLNYRQIAIGIGIIFVAMIVFLYIRNSRMQQIIKDNQAEKDTAHLVKVLPLVIDSNRKQVISSPPLQPAQDSVRKTEPVVRPPNRALKTDHPAEKKKEYVSTDHKPKLPSSANTSQKYILELTTTQTCNIKMNSMDIGILETGKTMKVYLKPGKYLLQATSTTDPSAVYSGNIQVDQDNINEVGKLKIRL